MAESSVEIFVLAVTSAASLKYSKMDNSAVDCTVTFNDGRVLPYTASATDPEAYGQQLWADISAGIYGTVTAFTPRN